MKRTILGTTVLTIILLGIVINSVVSRSVKALEKEEPQLKIGMTKNMFRDVQPNMIKVLAKPFHDLLSTHVGMTGEVRILDDSVAMMKELNNDHLNMAVFHGFEYAWVQQVNDNIEPLVVAEPHGGKARALIIVHADCPARNLAQLEDAEIMIPKGTKEFARVYLNKMKAESKNKGLSIKDCKTATPEDLLNQVVNAEASAVLIDYSAWLGYQFLQPGAHKRLKILEQSEDFPLTVVVYLRKKFSSDQVKQIRQGLATAHQTPRGKLLTTLWNLKSFQAPPINYNEQVEKCLKAYPMPEQFVHQSEPMTSK